MTLGIDHSKKVLSKLGEIAVDVIGIVKHGIGIGALRQLLALEKDVKDFIAEAPKALPELKDIDHAEAQALAVISYDVIKAVVAAIAA